MNRVSFSLAIKLCLLSDTLLWTELGNPLPPIKLMGFLVAQTVKNLPTVQETWVPSLDQEDPLEKRMATHSSILAWRIPRTEEHGGLSPRGLKESDTNEQHFHFLFTQINFLKPFPLMWPYLGSVLKRCMHVKSLQLCLSLCELMDHSLPGFSVHGILWARTLEWAAMPSSMGSSQPRDQILVSRISCIGRRVLYHWHHLGSPLKR